MTMNARTVIAKLPVGPGDTRQALLYARLLIQYLADNVYLAEPELRDAIDFHRWLRELAEEVEKLTQVSA